MKPHSSSKLRSVGVIELAHPPHPARMMTKQPDRIFGRAEAALGYALCAERLFGEDATFLDQHAALVPIFVSHLFQSLEISIKHAGIESKLFTEDEARGDRRKRLNGHEIGELAKLATERLGGDPFEPLLMAMTCGSDATTKSVLREMICGPRFEPTRACYRKRDLGYAEVSSGSFQILYPIPEWIRSVKQVALDLDKTVQVLSQWTAQASKSTHFALWYAKT